MSACPVCFQALIDGRVLDCGHTYCLQCITKMAPGESELLTIVDSVV